MGGGYTYAAGWVSLVAVTDAAARLCLALFANALACVDDALCRRTA